MAKETFGLVGHPVKHSLSPAMQNAAFKELGIDAEYRLYDVEPAALSDFIGSAGSNKISGLNITIPHKIKAKEYLEKNGSLDPNAQRLGAVNTIKAGGDTLCGFNTDGPGFYRSLVEDLRYEPEGKDVFVLGAGGAAQAIIMYLGNGPERISVFDIDPARAEAVKKQYAKYFDVKRLHTISDKKLIKTALDASSLLVNTTPVGMHDSDPSPVDKALLHPGLAVYDIIYNRPYTQLIKDANSLKLHAATGLGMFLYQGAIAFEIWTGKKAPVAVMKRALKEALTAVSKGA